MAESSDSNASSSIPLSSLALFSQLPPISVKLSDGNFLMWQQQVDIAVCGYGLEGFLTGEEAAPPQMIPDPKGSTKDAVMANPAYVTWQRQDRRIASWLLSSLSETALILVVGLRSARDIWSALETNFASRSTAKIMQYRQQMQNLKKDGLSMNDFLSKMRSYFDLLGSVGCRISESEQILHILSGLGQEYDPAVCSITSRSEPWGIADASAFLLSFESRMESTRAHSVSIEGSQPSLNIVQQSGQRRDTVNSSFSSKFDSGGGRGGSRNQRGGRGGRGFGRGSNKIVCQLCEKPGHTASKCWHRFEQNYAPPQQMQNRGNSSQQQHTSHFNPAAHLVQSVPRPPSTSHSFGTSSEYNYDAASSASWYPDSGATHHISNDLSNLNISTECAGGKKLILGNGSAVSIANIGETMFESHSPNFSRKLHLRNLLHVPNITKNLLSVSQFAKDNSVFFEFHPNFCFVKDQCTKEIVLKGTLDNGLYHFLIDHSPIKRSSSSNPSSVQDHHPAVYSAHVQSLNSSSSFRNCASPDLAMWHSRLGHPTLDVVKTALTSCNVPFVAMKSPSLCDPCCVSKAHRLPYSSSSTVVNAPLELIHSDLWGPSPITSRNGFKYYISFVDHYSRFTWIYLLKNKFDAHSAFTQFKAMVENSLNSKIKALQSDWGGEFQGLTSFLKESGITHRVSCPYTPQQNGLAERKHRHIVETGLALLSQASLPQKFWDDAFLTSVYLINLMPSKVIHNLSPYEKLFSKKPDYSFLRIFGCLCYPLTRPYNAHKLDFRSVRATFLGYSHSHKGYKALLPNGKVIITRDIIFDESVFPYNSSYSVQPPTLSQQNQSAAAVISPNVVTPSAAPDPFPSSPSSDTSSASHHSSSFGHQSPLPDGSSSSPSFSSSASDTHTPHASSVSDHSPAVQASTEHIQPTSAPQPKAPTHSMTTRSKAGIFKPKVYTLTISPHLLPRSALEAILIPVWKAAMLSEFLALLRNKTWILTTLPPGKNLIGCTWVFKLKFHLSGAIARYKARLVAQGFSQQPGFDFNETFSPVVKPTTIRLILSIAVSLDWSVTHLDVNNAFLNGELKEDIYMKQPVGFEQGGPHLVCKLNKAIYGLKQASRAWLFTIHSVLMSLGFSQSKADASMFFRQSKDEVIYLLIYVDDMLITGNSPESIQQVISQLNSYFSLKDLGEVNLFLGVEVVKLEGSGLHLCQSAYIKDLLKKANMMEAKGCPTPMVSSCELSKTVGEPISDPKMYRSIVGALQYATITRPDINFAVNKVSQYMASPLDTHWRAVKRILRYLSGTLDYGIQIHKSNGLVSAFSDSDWASDVDDRRSVSGFCTYYGGNLISWCVKKQTVVARSSTEAEYRSLASAAAEVAWINSLLGELKIKKKSEPVIWVDNMSAIALASNPVLHARTKHIELDIHFVRDKVLAKEIELRHVPTIDQIADIFTKPLSRQSFEKLRSKLGLVSLASLGLRGRVEDHSKQKSKAACSLALHEEMVSNDKALDDNVMAVGARDIPRTVTGPQDMQSVNVDHKRTWKDVALQGSLKDKCG